jgi:hypothetical protein
MGKYAQAQRPVHHSSVHRCCTTHQKVPLYLENAPPLVSIDKVSRTAAGFVPAFWDLVAEETGLTFEVWTEDPATECMVTLADLGKPLPAVPPPPLADPNEDEDEEEDEDEDENEDEDEDVDPCAAIVQPDGNP